MGTPKEAHRLFGGLLLLINKMDFERAWLEIQRREDDYEYFYNVEIVEEIRIVPLCPKCTRPFIPTAKSPEICLFCNRIFNKT